MKGYEINILVSFNFFAFFCFVKLSKVLAIEDCDYEIVCYATRLISFFIFIACKLLSYCYSNSLLKNLDMH